MTGTHVLSRLADGHGDGNMGRDGDKYWAHTRQGMYVCTQVMYTEQPSTMCRAAAIQAQYTQGRERQCEGDTTSKRSENGEREREGTHNRLAAPVLMLRPAGPLADLAKAIVDIGAASLLS